MRWFIWVGVLTLLLLACPGPVISQEAGQLKKIRLMLMWQPQAQFAGYYMAREKGIYTHYGLDVAIIEGGPGLSPVRALQNGDTDFAVFWLTTALKQQGKGAKLVHLAQIVQSSSLLLVTKKSSGITSTKHFQGRRVGLWNDELSLSIVAFLSKHELTVQQVSQNSTINLFLRGGVDAISAMWYNEYHSILMAGLDADELQVFALRDYGINVPEDGLYTLQSTYHQNPTFAKAFTKASLEGWQYAFAHPEETVDVLLRVIQQAKIPACRAHQQWMLARMRPEHSDIPMGALQPESFQNTAKILQDHGHISIIPDYHTFVQGE